MLAQQIPVLLNATGDGLFFHAPLTHNLTLERGSATASFTRATTATVWGYDATDNWTLLTCASGEARFQGARRISQGNWSNLLSDGTPISASVLGGYLCEGIRVNYCLHNRNLTDAAWTKTDCTAAKDQTGIDGTENSASSLTATAGNATCLQSITRSSASRITCCWIKRITGTGTINVTQDNGTTWTAVTVTGSWTRVNVPAATAANPILGFQIVTSGDAVAVDYVQHEEVASGTAFLSSDIATTTASVQRNADNLAYTAISGAAAAYSVIYAETTNVNQYSWQLDSGGASRILTWRTGGNYQTTSVSVTPPLVINSGYASATSIPPDKTALLVRGSAKLFINGAQRGATDADAPAFLDFTALRVARFTSDGFEAFGITRNVKLYRKALADAKLVSMTA
jgi:hypothetical protein